MNENGAHDPEAVAACLHEQASTDAVRISLHAHQEMVEEDISYEEVCEVLLEARVVENYPEHKRGPCCLICRRTSKERYVHVVCTTSLEVAVIITVYEPTDPKWVSPFERGKEQ